MTKEVQHNNILVISDPQKAAEDKIKVDMARRKAALPSKITGIYDEPLIVPETPYEKCGFRGEVIFPGGMILEDSGEVKIYYGAADTVECLATADVNDLLNLCRKI